MNTQAVKYPACLDGAITTILLKIMQEHPGLLSTEKGLLYFQFTSYTSPHSLSPPKKLHHELPAGVHLNR